MFVVSVDQKFMRELIRQFWLKTSHEVAVKMCAPTPPPEGFTGVGAPVPREPMGRRSTFFPAGVPPQGA